MVTSIPLLFALGIFPSIFWLFFFLLESRKHPEPPRIITRVFIAGLIAAVVAALTNLILQLWVFPIWKYQVNSLTGFMIFAFIEEIAKFLFAYIAFKDKRTPDSHLDDMIYLITAAMGFAALENLLYIFQAFQMNPALVIQTIIIRSIGATFLHAVASGFTGYYLAKGRLLEGLIIATIIHTAFNYTIYYFPQYLVCSVIMVLLASFFLFHDFDIIKESDE